MLIFNLFNCLILTDQILLPVKLPKLLGGVRMLMMPIGSVPFYGKLTYQLWTILIVMQLMEQYPITLSVPMVPEEKGFVV